MNNIIFEKIWEDNDLIELKITAISKFVTAFQNCYIKCSDLLKLSEEITKFAESAEKSCYIEIGKKEGNYTPAFSMNFEKVDVRGNLRIEVDIEIEDTETREHRCCFYVEGKLGSLDSLGLGLNELISKDLGTKVELYEI